MNVTGFLLIIIAVKIWDEPERFGHMCRRIKDGYSTSTYQGSEYLRSKYIAAKKSYKTNNKKA